MTRNRPVSRGQHIVITGGSSGLGLALGRRFAQAGARLTLLARDPEKLRLARLAILEQSPDADVSTVSVDVSDAAALTRAFDQSGTSGPIDVLVNSAGILREGYFEALTDDDFRAVMEVNFFGTVNAVRAALPHLKKSRGRVINIASVAGLMGVFGYTSYTSSKHALVGFTDALRYELEPQGITVQLVCPGEFDSPMVADLDLSRTPENRAHTLTIPKADVGRIADEIVDSFRSGTPVIIPGLPAKLVVLGQRLAPGIGRVVGRRRIAAVYRGHPGG